MVLAVGAARPQASVPVPSDSSSILLAIDVSASMCSTDVAPNRITAAKKAAKDFIEAQEGGAKIGLVAFSGIAALLVEPTDDKGKLESAIDSLRTSRGTAIGLAILAAIDAIAEINPDVPATGVDPPESTGTTPGDYMPDTIVVLTDGANIQGIDPVTAAEQAAARRIRIYTIGFGTTEPSPLVCTPDQITSGGFGGGRPDQRRGFGRAQQIDEDSLKQVADITGGKYFQAKDASELAGALRDLPDSIVLQRENVEISAWFALTGALLVLAGIGLAQWWNRSVPAPGRPVPTPVRGPD